MKILFHPIEAWGHMNASIGMAQIMYKRGHRIIFVITDQVKGQFSKYGFEELVLNAPTPATPITRTTPKTNGHHNGSGDDCDGRFSNGNHSLSSSPSGSSPPSSSSTSSSLTSSGCNTCVDYLVQHSNLFTERDPLKKYGMFEIVVEMRGEEILQTDEQLKQFLEREQPDLIIVDQLFVTPIIMKSGIPWCNVFSCNPISFRNDVRLPPPFSGLPMDDRSLWPLYRNEFMSKYQYAVKSMQNRLMVHYGHEPLQYEGITPPSPYLNIYGYPEELDYVDVAPMPYKCFRIDTFCRSEPDKFELPADFIKSLPSGAKLIYISLGTLASVRFDLIKKILSILAANPKYGYIVSKGQFDDGLTLPKNIYGLEHLPQTKILPMVDLVITHGGNNTVTETLKFGKPMIVMPFFVDQYDNAERIQYKGYGVRIDPFDFDGTQLMETMERLLNDQAMLAKLKIISKRIQTSNVNDQLGEYLENMIEQEKQNKINGNIKKSIITNGKKINGNHNNDNYYRQTIKN